MTDATEPTVPPRPRDPGSHADPGSFRDPGGRVFHRDGEIYRTLDRRALDDWKHLARADFFSTEQERGRIVATRPAPEVEPAVPGSWEGVLHHERVPVVSYPYEWTFSMLRHAALLQLDLLAAALEEDMILKDSTPYNVQWRGCRPVFIDIGSFERHEPGDVWVGYRQFLRQYLYPLLLQARIGVPFRPWLRGEPEGPTAGEMWRMLPVRERLRRSVLLHVGMQARAEHRYRHAERDVRSELKAAGFRKELIEANVRGLRRAVAGLDWEPGESVWSGYAESCGHVAVQREAKGEFLAGALAGHPPSVVWDVGANDGHFSRQAAATADHVVAIDADEPVLDGFYRSLTEDGPSNILPLVQDLAAPSPGLGWRGVERTPLTERSSPDLVICFAVIHHLVIGRNLPLREVVDWLADLGGRVILEFVPPGDPMVERLVANKRPHEIHGDYHEDALRTHLADRFLIDRETGVPGGERRMFELRPIG